MCSIKKLSVVIFSVLCLFLIFFLYFSSPIGMRLRMLNSANEGNIAINRLEQIIRAIEQSDEETIKNMFSEQVRDEVKYLDEGIAYLFALVDGKIESWERIGGQVNTSMDHGTLFIESSYRFSVETSAGQYLFSIRERVADSEHPQNIGLYSLKVINMKDDEPIFTDSGIYMP